MAKRIRSIADAHKRFSPSSTLQAAQDIIDLAIDLARTEHEEQAVVKEWAIYNIGRYPALRWLYAIPNGGLRHPNVAKKLKAEGVEAGVSDLCLPFPNGGYHGLYIEMKRAGGRLKKSQQEFLDFVNQHGYFTAVCYSADEAIANLEFYLGLDKQ